MLTATVMVNPMTILDAVINDIPGWGYLPMLTVAFSASMLVAGRGLRLCAALLTRARSTGPR